MKKIIREQLKKQLNEDIMYDDHTGLVFYYDIPFVKENIEELIKGFKSMQQSMYTKGNQFIVKPSVLIIDDSSGAKHNFTFDEIAKLSKYYKKNKNKIADRADFE